MDLYLRAADKATMHAAMRATYEALARVKLAAHAPTPAQAAFASGVGGWVVDDIGAFYEQNGVDAQGKPVMVARTGYHVFLRWNTGDPVPPLPVGIEIVWRSDALDVTGKPVPPPVWWNRVIA